jgi:hypothetical protein
MPRLRRWKGLMRLLLLLHGLEWSQCLIKKMVNNEPRSNHKHEDERQLYDQSNSRCLLPPLDGGNDRRTAFWTSPRMVADLPAAFVTLDECHKLFF